MARQSMQSLPAQHALEMQELAGTYRLGTPVAEYRGGFTEGEKRVLFYVVAFVDLLCFAVVWSLLKNNPATALLGLGLAVLSVWLIFVISKRLTNLPALLPRRSWHVYIFSGGFVFTREGKLDVAHWEEIQAIWHQIERRWHGRAGTDFINIYTIVCADGRRIVFDDQIKDVEKLGNLLNEQIAHVMWPRTIAYYQAGQVIPFGPLGVSQQGISNGRELLPWSEIKEIKFDSEDVKVHQKGKLGSWEKVSIGEIPNLFLLKALTRSVLEK